MIRLTVICITYNHVRFLRRALDGFVSQKTDFEFEVLLHDDASTDGTTEIVREYAARYPEVIRPMYETENQYAKGVPFVRDKMWPLVRGEYVAVCEGDDYWTDEHKLQKQVDWLDAHPDSNLCFHPVRVVFDDGSERETVFPDFKGSEKGFDVSFDSLLRRNFIQTNSVVYRWQLKGREDEVPSGIAPGDWFIHLLHAEHGTIGFLPDVMACYNRHPGGIWWGSQNRSDAFFIRMGLRHLAFFKAVQERFGYKQKNLPVYFAVRILVSALKSRKYQICDELFERFADEGTQALRKIADFETSEDEAYLKMKKLRRQRKFLIVLSLILLGVLCVFALKTMFA